MSDEKQNDLKKILEKLAKAIELFESVLALAEQPEMESAVAENINWSTWLEKKYEFFQKIEDLKKTYSELLKIKEPDEEK